MDPAETEAYLARTGAGISMVPSDQVVDRPGIHASSESQRHTEQVAPRRTMIALNSAAAETLRCLFFHGPTWDGNVPSKSGRDDLVNMGLAARGNGWQWLTKAGVEACFANGIEREKERREADNRKHNNEREAAIATLLRLEQI